jgi:ankyrin repeat protein
VLAIELSYGRALLISFWLVQPLAGLAAENTDLELESWTNAIRVRDVDTLSRLLNSGFSQVNAASAKGKTALMVIAQAAEQQLSQALVDSGADINARNQNGGTPLMHAAVSGDVTIVGLLLVSGAKVNVQAGNGWTALGLAAAKGRVSVVDQLLKSGANANLADIFGWTALIHAAEQKRLTVVQLLTAQPGIAIDARTADGATALHRAAAQGFLGVTRILIDKGADPGIMDNKGRTPFDYAQAAGHPQLLEDLSG